MKYQTGAIGRVIVVHFEDGDEILVNLSDIARKEEIRAAIFYLVGGLKEGRIVAGPETDVLPPAPFWRDLTETHETLGTGTIFWDGTGPKIHFHGVFGKHESVKAGCLRESATTFIIMEAVILEIKGVEAVRDLDPLSNMVIMKIQDR